MADLALLHALMKTQKLDAIVSLAPQTRLWYTGLNTSAGWLFIEKKAAHLIIDGRYYEHASKHGANLSSITLLVKNALSDFATNHPYLRLGIEADYLTVAELRQIEQLFPKAALVEISGAALREVKTASEIALMRKAAQIAHKALRDIKPLIKAGTREIDLAIALEHAMKLRGATKGSFDFIVASGPRGSLPHGTASTRKLREGELVTIDFGAYYQGYASDITRTFKVGKVTNDKLLTILKVVHEAQQLGIQAVRPGVKASVIDAICRDYITQAGYGAYFVHSTGHGLGIDVHELPVVNANVATSKALVAGNVITVEPGIYIPQLGGVRFEDDVLVTATGYEVL